MKKQSKLLITFVACPNCKDIVPLSKLRIYDVIKLGDGTREALMYCPACIKLFESIKLSDMSDILDQK